MSDQADNNDGIGTTHIVGGAVGGAAAGYGMLQYEKNRLFKGALNGGGPVYEKGGRAAFKAAVDASASVVPEGKLESLGTVYREASATIANKEAAPEALKAAKTAQKEAFAAIKNGLSKEVSVLKNLTIKQNGKIIGATVAAAVAGAYVAHALFGGKHTDAVVRNTPMDPQVAAPARA